jgi:hypothetical protein
LANSQGWITSAPLGDSTSVWPSGAARLTSLSATRPPAPGLLSTMTFWPNDARSFSASRAGNDIHRPTGRKAHEDLERAFLCKGRGEAKAATAASAVKWRRFII